MSFGSISPAPDASRAAWRPDLGNGIYKNPVINADYSDPDVICTGADYWMIASSFNHVPGLPILHSRDLVNWTLVNHALPLLVPHEHFSSVHPGHGVWAPSLRYHADKFWIYYPDPDFGIYAITSSDPRGKWSVPVLVKGGKGLIDPCPLWDDDGQVYLVHGWAKSRSGICNKLTLHRLTADGLKPIDEGRVIINADSLSGWNWLEGPKLYKRNGWYYIFAPAGGVESGWQAVFRSHMPDGPYEHRIVLEQGGSPINGPHQGAWVETPSGEHWFFHFQKIRALGRVVHLQPMHWGKDDWPQMGTAVNTGGMRGNPLPRHAKPKICGTSVLISEPATSDDFSTPKLGRQWQWQANPRDAWARLDAAGRTLHLACAPMVVAQSYWLSRNLLLQKFPAAAFTVTVLMRFQAKTEGCAAGLMVFGCNYAWLGIRRENGKFHLVLSVCQNAPEGNREHVAASMDATPFEIFLRVAVTDSTECRFHYSGDGKAFSAIGGTFLAASGIWVGAKVGLFASSPPAVLTNETAAFQNFIVTG
jgi:beta-xylosidase